MYPHINGIELRNYEVVQDTYFQKHVKGDIYYHGKLCGYYNPCYFVRKETMPQVLIRIDNDTELDKYAKGELLKYHSILDYKETIVYIDGEPQKQSGIKVLLQDLEILIQLYEAMKAALISQRASAADDVFMNFVAEGLVGIINNNSVRMLKCQPGMIKGTPEKRELLKQIEEHYSLNLDENYPTLLFLTEFSFGIYTDLSLSVESKEPEELLEELRNVTADITTKETKEIKGDFDGDK